MKELLSNPIVHGALVLALAFLVSKFLYKKDEKIEDRRRTAIELSQKARDIGFTWVADFLTDYAVGDYDAIGTKLVKMRHLAKNDAAFKAEVDSILKAIVEGKLKDADGRKEIAAMLEEVGGKVGFEPPKDPNAPSTLNKIEQLAVDAAKKAANAAMGVA